MNAKEDLNKLECFCSRAIPHQGSLTVETETTGCEGTENHIRYLEHVEVVLSLSFTRRGDLTIYLTSPLGTRSTLLGKRRVDYSSKGFKNWAFMTTHNWEENPKGKWTLEIENAGKWNLIKVLLYHGTFISWYFSIMVLLYHGKTIDPLL